MISGAETKRIYLYSIGILERKLTARLASEFSVTFDANYEFRSLLPFHSNGQAESSVTSAFPTVTLECRKVGGGKKRVPTSFSPERTAR